MRKHKRAYKYLLWKAYFDKGIGVTSYVKYVIALMGLYSYANDISIMTTMIVGVTYLISCFFIGRFWYIRKLTDVENEISNMFNPFQREVRRHIKQGKKFKYE